MKRDSKNRGLIFLTSLLLWLLFPDVIKANEVKTIAQAKAEKGVQTIVGYVSVPPNQLSKQYFYLEDQTSGIQIYQNKGDFPPLFLGYKARVTGEIKEAYKEYRLSVSSLEILPGIQTPSPQETLQINEAVEGKLVTLKGYYQKSEGNNFYLENAAGTNKITLTSYAVENGKIKKPEMEKGDYIQVTGIASQYDTATSPNNYRLLPRFPEDIQILAKATTEKEDKTLVTEENEESSVVSSIAEVRNKSKGEEVFVEGIVSVAPFTLSRYYFYLQDNSGGMQIYFSKGSWPELKIGQKIRVNGEISEAYGEKRIKIAQPSDIVILGQEKEPEALCLKINQIQEDKEGMLVKIQGSVTTPSGNIFYLDDGTGKIKIYLKKEAQIQKPRLQEGEQIVVLGIVSQYKDSYRVLPRQTADLKTPQGEILIEAKQKAQSQKEKQEPQEKEETETEEPLPASTNDSPTKKVLSAEAEKNQPINYLPFALAFFGLGVVGYLINDFRNAKRKGNPDLWQKIRQAIERRRDSRFKW